jgi:hypothetical protein
MSYSVSQISKFMHAPRSSHLEAIHRILRYLKGALGKGILMKNNSSNEICSYSDANWAGSYDRKSTTGFCTFIGENLVTWKNKKQNVVARSSVEMEYRVMTSTASELIWIKQLLRDMGLKVDKPIQIFYDNQVAQHIALNPIFHERTKHIEIDCHFIREKLQAKEIETPFVRSEDQLTDIFMKGLEPRPFNENTDKFELIDIYNPNLRGNVEDIEPKENN